MAIAPTGAIYKSLTFDGEDSRNYGVYITGEAVYNAPAREVEMISIPGRNGAFALDKGRFENIEVTYPAGIFADNEEDFAEAISEFRNFLCSRSGYVRLQDDYNPNEYRMAIYKSGLEVSPAQLRAGEFDIVFDCKPQRYLTSGEEAITVESGDTITNLTRFKASPMLETEGDGEIHIGNFTIKLEDVLFGNVIVSDGGTDPLFDYSAVNTGDDVSIGQSNGNLVLVPYAGYYHRGATLQSETWTEGSGSLSTSTTDGNTSVNIIFNACNVSYGVAQTLWNMTAAFTLIGRKTGTSTDIQLPCTLSVRIEYNADGTVAITKSYMCQSSPLVNKNNSSYTIQLGMCYADSTKGILGFPTYIDCDLGTAYKIEDGSIISLNQYIDLGSELPTLASGENEITYDDTITSLKITPRWWKI